MQRQQIEMAEELLFSEDKAPSFAKKLFFGAFSVEELLPYPDPSYEEKAKLNSFLAKVDAFAQEKIDPSAIDANAEMPDDVIEGLGKLGVLGMTIPTEYGGLGMSQHAYCRTCELLARRCGSTALFVNAHQSVGLKALLLFGSEEQKRRYLPPLARGEKIAAFSLTEPDAGSDAAAIATRADYDALQQLWVITGDKQWTTNGSIASFLTVMAKTKEGEEGKEKITAFIVEPPIEGFEIKEAALDKVGMRGTKTANLRFNRVKVAEENILGPKGAGLRVCLTVLDYGRTTFGATCTGSAKTALDLALRHSAQRHQFGKPLSAFPLIKKKLARMGALVYAMEATTYLTAALVDRGAEDFMLEAAILKVFASESLWQIIYDSMQVFGGRSFFTDLPLERMMRDARLNMIGEGANEVLRLFIAAVGLRDLGVDLQRVHKLAAHPLAQWRPLAHAAFTLLSRLRPPHVPLEHPALLPERKRLGKLIRSFGWQSFKSLVNYRERIIDEQLVLNRLATAAIGLYTATAVLARIHSELCSGKSEQLALLQARTFCHMAFESIEKSLSGNLHSSASESFISPLSEALIAEVMR